MTDRYKITKKGKEALKEAKEQERWKITEAGKKALQDDKKRKPRKG